MCCTKKLARPTSSSASSGSCMEANAATRAGTGSEVSSWRCWTTASQQPGAYIRTQVCAQSSSTGSGAREQRLLLVRRAGAERSPASPACHAHPAAEQSMFATPCTLVLPELSAESPAVCCSTRPVPLQAFSRPGNHHQHGIGLTCSRRRRVITWQPRDMGGSSTTFCSLLRGEEARIEAYGGRARRRRRLRQTAAAVRAALTILSTGRLTVGSPTLQKGHHTGRVTAKVLPAREHNPSGPAAHLRGLPAAPSCCAKLQRAANGQPQTLAAPTGEKRSGRPEPAAPPPG